jgi:hypothetical protein
MQALLAQYGIYDFVLPSIAGSYKGKNLAVCGDGHCLWSDLEALGCRSDENSGSIAKPGWDFMTVNMAGSKFPGIVEHWFSNDGNLVDLFRSVRRAEYPRSFEVRNSHGIHVEPGQWVSPHPNAWQWPWPGRGTSGLGAVLTGIGLGYDRIVICGIPLNNQPHNGEPPWRRTNFTNEVRDDVKHWLRVAEHFGDRIRAMSGQPRDWFGHPSDCDCRSEGECGLIDGRCQNANIAVC